MYRLHEWKGDRRQTLQLPIVLQELSVRKSSIYYQQSMVLISCATPQCRYTKQKIREYEKTEKRYSNEETGAFRIVK